MTIYKTFNRLWFCEIGLLVGFLFFGNLVLNGQSNSYTDQRFRAGLRLGTTASQISGDAYKGYRKAGLLAGVEGFAQLKDRTYLSLGFLFTEIGSIPSDSEKKRDQSNFLEIQLTYLELPLLVHFQGKAKERYRPFDFHVGFSLARLLSSRITSQVTISGPGIPPLIDLSIVNRQNEFKQFNANFQLGLSYYFIPQFGLSLRHVYGFQDFYQAPADVDTQKNLRNFYWSVSGTYIIR